MGMTHNIRYGLFLIILLVLSSTALAQSVQISLESFTGAQTISLCGNATFDYQVTNLGEFIETYDLGVEPFADTSLLSENPLVLQPGESKGVRLFVFPPCDSFGSFDVTFFVQERITGTLFQAQTPLEIIPVDFAEIAPGIDTLRIANETLLLEIPVTNKGPNTAVYDVTLEGEDWITLRSDTFQVAGGDTVSIEIVSSPPEGTEEADYPLTLVLTSTTTGLEYAKEFVVSMKTPTLVDELLTTYLAFTVAGFLLLFALIMGLVALIIYLVNTKEERALRKEERREAKEALKEDKRLAKEEVYRMKQEAREAKLRAKEESRRIRHEEKIAVAKEKEAYKREQERVKDEQRKSKEDTWQKRQDDKSVLLKQKRGGVLEQVLFGQVKHDYKLILKDPTFKKSRKGLLFVLLILIGLALAGYFMWEKISPYKNYILLGVGVAVGLFILFEAGRFVSRRRLLKYFTDDEKNVVTEKVKDALKAHYYLIKKEFIRQIKEKLPWKKLLFFLVVVLATVASYVLRSRLGEYAQPLMVGLGALVVLLLFVGLLAHMKYTKNTCKAIFGELKPQETQTVRFREGKGCGEVIFTLKKGVESVALKLERSKRKVCFLIPPGEVFQYLHVTKYGLADNDVDKTLLRFKVPKKWLSCMESVHVVRYSRQKWMRIGDCKQVREDDKYAYYEAEHKGLNVGYALVGKVKVEKQVKAVAEKKVKEVPVKEVKTVKTAAPVKKVKKTKKSEDEPSWASTFITIGVFVLLILFLVLGVQQAQKFMGESDTSDTSDLDEITKAVEQLTEDIAGIESTPAPGIPAQKWTQGETHKIDLGKFFSDPDGELLEFSHTSVEGLDIAYDGSIAIITSVPGYYGEQSIVFTATDPQGESVSSNAVTLTVLKDNTLYGRLSRFFGTYGMYVVLGVALLVLIVLIVEVKKRIDEGEETIEEDFDTFREK